ncbi:MAG: putative Ig domain-containing protein [Candidatus Paceibacterota bacterium]
MNSLLKQTTRILALSFAVLAFTTSVLPGEVNGATRNERCEDVTIVLDETRVYVNENERFEYEIETKGGDVDTYDVKYLPRGLSFDEDKGVLSGRIEDSGTYRVELIVSNDCSEDTVALRIVVREKRAESGSGTLRNDHNVTLETRFVPNDEKGYVYLTEIPYTGAGDVLRLSLIGLALTLWAGALGFALLNPARKEQIKSVFVKSTATAYAPQSGVPADSVETPFFGDTFVEEEEVIILDSEELQILRSHAHEEKVLFSEDALKAVVTKSQALGGPSLELLSTVIDGAKATYPREDGFVKINNERILEILA